MNKKRHFLLSAVLATTLAANAQVTINVDVSNPGVKVSPNLYGIFFEDINHAADGGLYAELISNRSFEDDDKNIPTWQSYGWNVTIKNFRSIYNNFYGIKTFMGMR